MRDIIRKFYFLGAIVAIAVVLGLLYQYYYFNKNLSDNTQMLTALSRDLVESEINRSLNRKGQIITDASDFISLGQWGNEELLAYLKTLMNNNPSFASIYFGTSDNVMINGSGWIPPNDFDLRTRPWYTKAVIEKKLIYTEAFVNASKDKLIITIAKPVYDSDKQFLGVIAGDVSIQSILSIVKDKKIGEKDYSFLIDGKGNILAHPNYEYDLNSKLKNIYDISPEIYQQMVQNKQGTLKISMDGIEGYLAYQQIENTDWKIGSFIPLDEYVKSEALFLRILIITLISSLGIFLIILGLEKKYIINPILALDKDVQGIDIENNTAYRVPIREKDPFTVLRKSINNVLDTTQDFFSRLEADEEELRAANEELESTFKQVEYLSYHDQLTGLYNRRFFEEELKRLDIQRNLPITIVMADVNGLKLTNDAFGHTIGDELLNKVAEVIKSACRADDIIARLGGDEFVILLPKTDRYEAEQIVRRIKSLCLKEKVSFLDLSVSFGWETKTQEDEEIHEILKKAEDYMYKKKLFESPSTRGKTIEVIIHTLYEKNKTEEQHSHQVANLCKSIGKALQLSEGEINELETVGLLHDIGKIAIEESILNKLNKLTDEEWAEIKRHSEIGYRILSSVNEMAEMAEYVLTHHERFDGNGYPKGLKGKEIPLQARIIAIADAYDAMTSKRSYRDTLTKEAAVEELKNNAGTQFDPELVKIFIEQVV